MLAIRASQSAQAAFIRKRKSTSFLLVFSLVFPRRNDHIWNQTISPFKSALSSLTGGEYPLPFPGYRVLSYRPSHSQSVIREPF